MKLYKNVQYFKIFFKVFAVLFLILIILPNCINELMGFLNSKFMLRNNSILVYNNLIDVKCVFMDFIKIVKKLILFL